MPQSKKKCDLCPYDAIYCHIVDKNKNAHLTKNEILPLIKGVLRLTKNYDESILKELESRGLIKRINHQKYYIYDSTSKQCMLARKRISKYKRTFPW